MKPDKPRDLDSAHCFPQSVTICESSRHVRADVRSLGMLQRNNSHLTSETYTCKNYGSVPCRQFQNIQTKISCQYFHANMCDEPAWDENKYLELAGVSNKCISCSQARTNNRQRPILNLSGIRSQNYIAPVYRARVQILYRLHVETSVITKGDCIARWVGHKLPHESHERAWEGRRG